MKIPSPTGTAVNGCFKKFLIRLVGAVLRPLSVVYDTSKYDRDAASIKPQVKNIYDCKLHKTRV
jgi:hypothetical protein